MLVSIIFFIGTLVMYVKFIQPTYKDIDLLRGQLDSKKRENGDYKNVIDRLGPVFDSFQSATQLQEIFSSVLPTNPMVPQAVAQLNGLANASLMGISSISVNELAAASQKTVLLKGTGIIDLNLTMTSNSYDGIKQFLENIQSNIRVFNVKRINIGKKETSGAFNVTLDVYAYYQIE